MGLREHERALLQEAADASAHAARTNEMIVSQLHEIAVQLKAANRIALSEAASGEEGVLRHPDIDAALGVPAPPVEDKVAKLFAEPTSEHAAETQTALPEPDPGFDEVVEGLPREPEAEERLAGVDEERTAFQELGFDVDDREPEGTFEPGSYTDAEQPRTDEPAK